MPLTYRTRFAPSPTGKMHMGHARTALVTWLRARSLDGHIVMRIEDLDRPRVVQGAADEICRDHEWLGLDWDEGPVYQSSRDDAYERALDRLDAAGLVYPCTCSRKEIAEIAKSYNVPVVVDAVSSIGGVELEMDAWGIDLCAAATQKCLGAPPGLGPIAISDRAWEIIESKPKRFIPFHWHCFAHYPPLSPAVLVWHALSGLFPGHGGGRALAPDRDPVGTYSSIHPACFPA